MKKYTKAESFRVNLENKTDRILTGISAMRNFAHIRAVPFPEQYAHDIANAIRKAADELEADLVHLSKDRRPFRLHETEPDSSTN